MTEEEDYVEEENPKTPVVPEEPVDGEEAADVGSDTASLPPVAKAFICARCKKGKLDPAGLSMGEAMACPDCGHLTNVTLEHLMGEARASQRQRAKKAFGEMSDEEKADYLATKTALEKFVIFVRFKLGAKGVAGIYLGLLVVVTALIVAYLLLFGGYHMRSVSIWTVIGTIVGAAVVGVVAHFGYVALMYHYKKMQNAKGDSSASRRASTRRRRSSIRRKKSVDEEE